MREIVFNCSRREVWGASPFEASGSLSVGQQSYLQPKPLIRPWYNPLPSKTPPLSHPPNLPGISTYLTLVRSISLATTLHAAIDIPSLSTTECRSNHGKEQKSIAPAQVEVAESWGVDSSAWDRTWRSLSGGEAQRVTLVYLAVGIPGGEVLLLDKPTSALDEETSELVGKYLMGLLGLYRALEAIIWITHRKHTGESCGNTTFVFGEGKTTCA